MKAPDELAFKEWDTWASYAEEKAKYLGEARDSHILADKHILAEMRLPPHLVESLTSTPTIAEVMEAERAHPFAKELEKEKMYKYTEIERMYEYAEKITGSDMLSLSEEGIKGMLGEENETQTAKRDGTRPCDQYGKGVEYESF